MSSVWRKVIICVSLVGLVACVKTQGTSTPEPLQVTPTLTQALKTTQATTEGSARTPSQTASPTVIASLAPPSPKPSPFLPIDLTPLGSDNIIQLQLLATLPVQEIYQLAFSVQGDKLVTLSEPWDDRFNDYLQVWDLEHGVQLLDLQRLPSPAQAFFSPDESQVYVFFASEGIDVYDLVLGEKIHAIALSDDQLGFSIGSISIALAKYQDYGDSSIVRLVDLATEQEQLSFTEPGMVMSLKLSPGGNLLAIGSQIGNHYRISVREIPSQRLVTDLVDYDSGLVFSPDNSLAAISKNGQVTLFSSPWMTWKASYGFSDIFTNPMPMDFSWSDGNKLLALEDRNTVRFLVAETGKELFSLPDACEVKFSPDAVILVSWCYQGDLKIWGVSPGS